MVRRSLLFIWQETDVLFRMIDSIFQSVPRLRLARYSRQISSAVSINWGKHSHENHLSYPFWVFNLSILYQIYIRFHIPIIKKFHLDGW